MEHPAPRQQHQIVLVPGFFGFGRFGELSYFNGVSEALIQGFVAQGAEVTVTEVTTLPTASIRIRAARVSETVESVAAACEGPIHVIGHSCGRLDARLAIAPPASLPPQANGFNYQRVKTLVNVCCSHFGTPLATFFSSALCKPLL